MVLTVSNLRNIILKRRPKWIKDDNVARSVELVEAASPDVKIIRADIVFPMDIEELLAGLEGKGVLLITGLENAHPYMVSVIEHMVLNHRFQKGCMSRSVPVPDSWRIVLVTPLRHRVINNRLYRELFKINNDQREVIHESHVEY
jgi:hypothetical protein